MKRLLLATYISLLCHPLLGLDLSHLNDYLFLDGKKCIDLQGFYSNIGKAEIKEKPFRGTHMKYSEGGASAYVGYYLNKQNNLCFQAGWSRMRLDWKENPRFKKKNFDDLILSVALVSTSIKNWRWVADFGAHIDTAFFNLAKHTFYTGFLWGMLKYKPYMRFHYGLLAQIGVKSKYVLPILGFDAFLSRRLQLNVVFPLDMSMAYYFTRNWKVKVQYRSFGGWYRANHRVGKNEPMPNALVTASSGGVDGGIYFDRYGLQFALFGGNNFGGWMLTSKPNKTEKRYYHFRSAPYVGGKLSVSF